MTQIEAIKAKQDLQEGLKDFPDEQALVLSKLHLGSQW